MANPEIRARVSCGGIGVNQMCLGGAKDPLSAGHCRGVSS